jgi:uncharacterized protein
LETLAVKAVRRLALCRAGLLKPAWAGFPSRAPASAKGARSACHAVVGRFGYLQLDTVSVAGARSHATVLFSRLPGLNPGLAEDLLKPGEPLFEYWGHEASWIPMDLYPTFGFRRREFVHHPWWGDVVGRHPRVAEDLRKRIRDGGPLRSADMEGRSGKGWWDLKVAKKVATALWSSGELAIRERANFQRTYDLAERVIPASLREMDVPAGEALETLILLALQGHGWAATGTLARTWRLRNRPAEIRAVLNRLHERGAIAPCALVGEDGKRLEGWIRPGDLDLAERLGAVCPRRDRGVLLSPFDPLLWDRPRVTRLFGFEQVLEIFKPAHRRIYGYYCLPVLAGDRLVARVDLRADRSAGTLSVRSCHYEAGSGPSIERGADGEAVRSGLARYAEALGLRVPGQQDGGPPRGASPKSAVRR